MDLTFFTSFHSNLSRASWYWYAADTHGALPFKKIFILLLNLNYTKWCTSYHWEGLHSRQCCCTSRPPGPSEQFRRLSTPSLQAAGWSGTLGCWRCRGPPTLATRTLSSSPLHAWKHNEKFMSYLAGKKYVLNTGLSLLTFHRSHWWPPSSSHGQRTTRSLRDQCWCSPSRSYCSPGVLLNGGAIWYFRVNTF